MLLAAAAIVWRNLENCSTYNSRRTSPPTRFSRCYSAYILDRKQSSWVLFLSMCVHTLALLNGFFFRTDWRPDFIFVLVLCCTLKCCASSGSLTRSLRRAKTHIFNRLCVLCLANTYIYPVFPCRQHKCFSVGAATRAILVYSSGLQFVLQWQQLWIYQLENMCSFSSASLDFNCWEWCCPMMLQIMQKPRDLIPPSLTGQEGFYSLAIYASSRWTVFLFLSTTFLFAQLF